MDSTFIGMIVKIYKNVSEKNGKIKLVVPSFHERDSFRMIGIRSVIECFDIFDEAVDSYDTKIPTRKVAFEIRNPEY